MSDSQGILGYYNLTDWWAATFSPSEQIYIENLYTSNREEDVTLTRGRLLSTTQSPAQFLWGLSTWFRSQLDFSIEQRILVKAEELAKSILDRHFVYQCAIQSYYKMREVDDKYFELAIEYCKKQIDLAPLAAKEFEKIYGTSDLPTHVGYKQLSIILEKQGKYQEAIRYLEKAVSEGWAGDWGKRILRCKKRLTKMN